MKIGKINMGDGSQLLTTDVELWNIVRMNDNVGLRIAIGKSKRVTIF